MAEAKAEIDTTLENIRTRGLAFINEHLSIRKLRTSSTKDSLANRISGGRYWSITEGHQ